MSADASDARGRSGAADYTAGRVPMSEDYRAIMAQRAVFQGIASMGLPAFTIHSIVRYSGRALKDAKNVRIRTYGPIGVSLPRILLRSHVKELTFVILHSSGSPLCLFYLSSLTSPLSMRPNGHFTRPLKPLEVQRRWLMGRETARWGALQRKRGRR